MEAVAPGRAWRGWRRAAAAGAPRSLAALLLLSALLRAPLAVGYLVRLPRSFRLTQDTVKIVGSPHFPVSVYVMLHQRSPHVLCVTQHLRNTELVDPSFQWHGPKGKIISENSTAQVTSTGSLIFQNFQESMSGIYTCFLQYRPTVEEIVKNLQLKYLIYAYREPRFYYQFTARYHAAPCNSIYNISFEKKLLQILSKLVLDLSCEIALLKSECHRIKMQKAGLQNELFFTFSVLKGSLMRDGMAAGAAGVTFQNHQQAGREEQVGSCYQTSSLIPSDMHGPARLHLTKDPLQPQARHCSGTKCWNT
uniref:zona pellucida-binding protein 1 isoform X1 n=1 Tax=Jaculus jaculus TaxID=51337 RepID=UPI001E1B1EDC|nr:zona pellucida-binding protein 1 isoform X1 [Jaculus jaculus]